MGPAPDPITGVDVANRGRRGARPPEQPVKKNPAAPATRTGSRRQPPTAVTPATDPVSEPLPPAPRSRAASGSRSSRTVSAGAPVPPRRRPEVTEPPVPTPRRAPARPSPAPAP